MDELDFIEGLTEKHASPLERLRKLTMDSARAAMQYAKTNPELVAGVALGGLAAGGGTYLVSRKGENGKSPDQEFAEGLLKRTEKGKGFGGELAHVTSKTVKNVADLAAKYPGAAAMSAVPAGAALGLSLAKKLVE